MKKVLLGLFAISAISMAQNYSEGTNLYLKAGIDLLGNYDKIAIEGIDLNDSDVDGTAFEIAAEVTKEVTPNLELGLGIAYQDHREPKDKNYSNIGFSMPGYTSVPIYVVGKYNFEVESIYKPYLKVDLGYSFNDDNGDVVIETEKVSVKVKDGVYFGFGAGIEYNNFTTELMYKINKAEMKDSEDKADYDYSRITLSFGYKFTY